MFTCDIKVKSWNKIRNTADCIICFISLILNDFHGSYVAVPQRDTSLPFDVSNSCIYAYIVLLMKIKDSIHCFQKQIYVRKSIVIYTGSCIFLLSERLKKVNEILIVFHDSFRNM